MGIIEHPNHKSGTLCFNFSDVYLSFSFATPINGYYSVFQQPVLFGYYLDENQQRFSMEGPKLNSSVFSCTRIYYSPPSSRTNFSYFSVLMFPPIFKVEPFNPESGKLQPQHPSHGHHRRLRHRGQPGRGYRYQRLVLRLPQPGVHHHHRQQQHRYHHLWR